MGFCSEDEYHGFLRDAPIFEALLVESGITIIKYYLDALSPNRKTHCCPRHWARKATHAAAVILGIGGIERVASHQSAPGQVWVCVCIVKGLGTVATVSCMVKLTDRCPGVPGIAIRE